MNIASQSYFSTMQLAIVEGRMFSRQDLESGSRVLIVDQRLAARFFNGQAAGRELRDANGTLHRIVGVVASGKYRTLQEAPRPTVYVPSAQEFIAADTPVRVCEGSRGSGETVLDRRAGAVHRAARKGPSRHHAARASVERAHARSDADVAGQIVRLDGVGARVDWRLRDDQRIGPAAHARDRPARRPLAPTPCA